MSGFWEVVPVVLFFGITAYIVKIVLDNSTRRKLIDKGLVDENVKYLYLDKPKSQTLPALKWGLVAIGIGIALFVGRIFEYDEVRQVTFGCMLLFGGLGLVIYYLIANRILEKHKQENFNGKPQ